MANLTVQSISQTGITPTFAAANALGDNIRNDGKSFLHIKNGGAASITVTFDSIGKCNQGFDHDVIITVTAAGERIVGPFGVSRFNDELGKLNIAYSAVTTVTVASFRMA